MTDNATAKIKRTKNTNNGWENTTQKTKTLINTHPTLNFRISYCLCIRLIQAVKINVSYIHSCCLCTVNYCRELLCIIRIRKHHVANVRNTQLFPRKRQEESSIGQWRKIIVKTNSKLTTRCRTRITYLFILCFTDVQHRVQK